MRKGPRERDGQAILSCDDKKRSPVEDLRRNRGSETDYFYAFFTSVSEMYKLT